MRQRPRLGSAEKTAGKDNPQDATWSLYGLGWVLQMQGKLESAEMIARQALTLRRNLKLRREDELVVADSLYQLAVVLWSQQRLEEAEAPDYECLDLYQKKAPSGWQTFNSRSTLAGILAAKRKYAEAESLLLSAYEGLKDPEGKFPAAVKPRLRETLDRLIRLYEETRRLDETARWKRKLVELDLQPPESKLKPSGTFTNRSL